MFEKLRGHFKNPRKTCRTIEAKYLLCTEKLQNSSKYIVHWIRTPKFISVQMKRPIHKAETEETAVVPRSVW